MRLTKSVSWVLQTTRSVVSAPVLAKVRTGSSSGSKRWITEWVPVPVLPASTQAPDTDKGKGTGKGKGKGKGTGKGKGKSTQLLQSADDLGRGLPGFWGQADSTTAKNTKTACAPASIPLHGTPTGSLSPATLARIMAAHMHRPTLVASDASSTPDQLPQAEAGKSTGNGELTGGNKGDDDGNAEPSDAAGVEHAVLSSSANAAALIAAFTAAQIATTQEAPAGQAGGARKRNSYSQADKNVSAKLAGGVSRKPAKHKCSWPDCSRVSVHVTFLPVSCVSSSIVSADCASCTLASMLQQSTWPSCVRVPIDLFLCCFLLSCP